MENQKSLTLREIKTSNMIEFLITNKHKDDRRSLVEWFNDNDVAIHSIKVLSSRGKSILGKHYNKVADEYFFVSCGKIDKLRLTDIKTGKRRVVYNILAGNVFKIPAMVAHTFYLKEDTVLFEAATKAYNSLNEVEYE